MHVLVFHLKRFAKMGYPGPELTGFIDLHLFARGKVVRETQRITDVSMDGLRVALKPRVSQ